MLRYRNYWIYSTGLAIAWAVVLLLALAIRGGEGVQPFLLIFSASLLAGCRRRLSATSIRRQSAGGRTAAKSDALNAIR